MPALVIKQGIGEGAVLELRGDRLRIGRAPDNDIWLNEPTIDPHHALLIKQGSGWRICALAEGRITRVDGRDVSSAALHHLCEVQFGEAVVTFVDHESSDAELDVPRRAPGSPRLVHSLRLGRARVVGLAGAPQLDGHFDEDGRLAAALALAEMAVAARDIREICNGTVRVVRHLLSVDRFVPIVQKGNSLRAFCEETGEFQQSLEALGVNPYIAHRCRHEGMAATWESARPSPNVACCPVRYRTQNLGLLYCDRADPPAHFSASELDWLAAVAGQVGVAVESMRRYKRMRLRVQNLTRQLDERFAMVGESQAMEEVRASIRKIASTEAGVLIVGESGTGKELAARAIHRHSRRRGAPLEMINCAAIPASVAESELFGHVAGAFTGALEDRAGRFELADGGTLVLDEVTEMAPECQVKLLRVLEDGVVRRIGGTEDRPVDVRIAAVTSRDPRAAVQEGLLRADLFYRLDRLRIMMPPLRERMEDVPLLTEHFLDLFCTRNHCPHKEVAAEVLDVFQAHSWPGNVRELRNVVEHMTILGRGPVLQVRDIPPYVREAATEQAGPEVWSLKDLERVHIIRALEHTGGNKSRTAELLGIDRSTLYAKLKSYEIEL
ncbi:MAG: sigma 54-interacting transcriptional regulator [Planctomycetota bacterium]